MAHFGVVAPAFYSHYNAMAALGAELACRHVDLERGEVVAQHQRHAVVLADAEAREPAGAARCVGRDLGPAPETLACRYASRHRFFLLPLPAAPFSIVVPRKAIRSL